MEQNTFIIVVGLSLVVFLLALRSIRVVPEYVRLVILALGRYAGTRGPGIAIVLPWEQAYRVDLRERFLEIPRQTSITKDNAPIAIDFLVYYRVIEPKLSILQIDDVVRASLNNARPSTINCGSSWTRSPSGGGSRSPASKSGKSSRPAKCRKR